MTLSFRLRNTHIWRIHLPPPTPHPFMYNAAECYFLRHLPFRRLYYLSALTKCQVCACQGWRKNELQPVSISSSHISAKNKNEVYQWGCGGQFGPCSDWLRTENHLSVPSSGVNCSLLHNTQPASCPTSTVIKSFGDETSWNNPKHISKWWRRLRRCSVVGFHSLS